MRPRVQAIVQAQEQPLWDDIGAVELGDLGPLVGIGWRKRRALCVERDAFDVQAQGAVELFIIQIDQVFEESHHHPAHRLVRLLAFFYCLSGDQRVGGGGGCEPIASSGCGCSACDSVADGKVRLVVRTLHHQNEVVEEGQVANRPRQDDLGSRCVCANAIAHQDVHQPSLQTRHTSASAASCKALLQPPSNTLQHLVNGGRRHHRLLVG